MIETIIAIGIVVLAAGGVGCGLYRGATGGSRCSACSGCGKTGNECKQEST